MYVKTKLLKSWMAGLVLALAALAPSRAQINVLWYGVDTAYNSKISTLAASAHTYDPLSNGSLSWNLTFWSPGDATPDFSNFNVLVVGSSDKGFFSNFNATRLLGAKDLVADARGDRTFLSGQDADWHYINSPGPVDDGPRGFLINAVNWAGSGTGLGVVALADGYFASGNNPGWMTASNSFLRDELLGHVAYFQDENVIIPVATAGFPVNEGLTTAGLSNWRTSSHMGFSVNTPGYLSINDAGSRSSHVITIVTASQAGGGTTGPETPPVGVPDGGSAILLLSVGLIALQVLRKRIG
jgi:hypothetical protein